jgi:hypothetical protein
MKEILNIIKRNILIKRTFTGIIFFAMTICSYGQNGNRFPLWTFHKKDVNIHGISVGLWSDIQNERNTNTNGIRLELIGLGIFSPMIPDFPTFEEQRSERINGLSLSATGTVCDCLTNGLSAGFVGQINYQVNGISMAMLLNLTEKHNGIMLATVNYSQAMNGLQFGFNNNGSEVNGVQVALTINESEKLSGLQIGIVNKSKNLRGIQIGIWNVNQKRKLPLLNWNFKRTKEKEIE